MSEELLNKYIEQGFSYVKQHYYTVFIENYCERLGEDEISCINASILASSAL